MAEALRIEIVDGFSIDRNTMQPSGMRRFAYCYRGKGHKAIAITEGANDGEALHALGLWLLEERLAAVWTAPRMKAPGA